jgi:hypothetical protein
METLSLLIAVIALGATDPPRPPMRLWRGTLPFLIGLALGVVVVVIGPRVAGPYLPEALRGKVELAEGDALTLGLRRFAPFVEDPSIQSVRKKTPTEGPPAGAARRTP